MERMVLSPSFEFWDAERAVERYLHLLVLWLL